MSDEPVISKMGFGNQPPAPEVEETEPPVDKVDEPKIKKLAAIVPLETPETPAAASGNGSRVYAHAPGMETPESPTSAPTT